MLYFLTSKINFLYRQLVTTNKGQTFLYLASLHFEFAIVKVDLTNVNNINFEVIGGIVSKFTVTSGIKDHRMSKIFDMGGYFYYFISTFINYERMLQVTVFKVEYDLTFSDSSISPDKK